MTRWTFLALAACGLVWSARPVAADSLADFLAYYAKRDKEVQSFRAILSGSVVVPRGSFDDAPMLPPGAAKPVPATDLRLPYRGELDYDKSLSAIRYDNDREEFNTGLLKPDKFRRLNFYNGKELFVEVHSGPEYKDHTLENGNSRTDTIIVACELPAFWAAGRLWLGTVWFHKEVPPLRWETYSTTEPGKTAFKTSISPSSFSVFTTSGPPHWDIERVDFYLRGAPTGRWSVGPWESQGQGIRVPTRWTQLFSSGGKVSRQEDITLEKFEVNPSFDLAYFSHTPRKDLVRLIVDGEQTIRIDPSSSSWWWWGVAGLGVLLVLVAIGWRQRGFGFFSK